MIGDHPTMELRWLCSPLDALNIGGGPTLQQKWNVQVRNPELIAHEAKHPGPIRPWFAGPMYVWETEWRDIPKVGT